MRKMLLVAGAVLAGIALSPQARAGGASIVVDESTAETKDAAARALARRLRSHGYWGFGRWREARGQLYLQAYRAPGTPVMVKMALDTGRIVAVKRFSRRHQRRGHVLPEADRLLAAAGRRDRLPWLG